MTSRRLAVALTVVGVVLLVPQAAAAQSFGIGPRFSFVRGNLSTGTPSTRLVGGTMRIATGPHTVLEGALDYRSYTNAEGTERVRETPMQGSVLFFLTRRAIGPYVGGGIGLYSQQHQTLSAGGLPIATATQRKVGWHLGAGLEVKLARHAAFFADYRFRFVRFGDPASADEELIHIPGTTVLPVLEKVKLSHEGSMWTSGVAFYF
jgi:opacity protein-like surface antigen